MPDEEFEGQKRGIGSYIALTPLMAATAMVVGGVYQGARGIRQADIDPYTKVISGRYQDLFKTAAAWTPDPTGMTPEVQGYVLESFRRRLGETGLVVNSMEEAILASQIPSIKVHLRAAFEEFKNVSAGQFGAKLTDLISARPITRVAGGALTNVEALTAALAEPSLGLAAEAQSKLVADLTSLGAFTEELLGAKPTFQMRMIGKDVAISELLINFYRRGGEVQFALPIPSESGIITRANGSQAAARRVIGNLAGFAEGAEELTAMTAPEWVIQRMRDVLPREDALQQLRNLQTDVRSMLISAPEEEQLLTFAQQMVMDPSRQAKRATLIQARERLARMGLGAGMAEGPIGKGVWWLPGAEPGILTPPHYGQAMTKAFPAGGPVRAQLFQVSPRALQEAGEQLGMGMIVPREDQMLLAREMEGRMRSNIRRRMYLDPTAPASVRFEKIMTLLRDNKATSDMLKGGATVEETMQLFERISRGTPEHLALAEAITLKEGEVLGFTKAGTEKVKTYGVDMMIRDFETIGGQSIVTTEGFYTPEKMFSPGGIKHSVEYGEAEAVKALGVRGKALELLRARGVPLGDPSNLAFAAQLRKAEIEAAGLYEGSMGLVVEGEEWSTWAKTGAGEKNFSRFNQAMRDRWMENFGALPAEVEGAAPGRFRETLFAAARERGVVPEEFFDPARVARRMEELRPGAAAGTLGIGRYGTATFTDDAFDIMKRSGWKDMYESMAMRVERDAAATSTLLRSAEAARATKGGITIPEMMERGFLRPGEGMAGTIFDPAARARFIEETGGGMIQLPHEYRIQGQRVSRIAIPEFPSGHAGFYTTAEGQVILKDLDQALRDVMYASVSDVGASATTAGELAATEPLGRYFESLSVMAMKERDVVGGRVAGSRRFAIGKDIFALQQEGRVLTEAGEIAPRALVAPEAFEQMMASAQKRGLVGEGTAGRMRALFREGALPVAGMKHPGRGMGFTPFYLGAAPTRGGFAPSQDMAYLSEELLPTFVGDLDFDPFEMDLLFGRRAMDEADRALRSGQVNEMMTEVAGIRKMAGLAEPKMAPEVFGPTGEPLQEFIAAGIERRAAAKRNVGIFTTKVTWPMGVAGEAANLGYKDWMRMRIWRESLEEAATLKVKHRMDLPTTLVDEMAEAWRTGQPKVITSRVQEMFKLSEEATAEFGGLMGRLSSAYQEMGAADREFAEALFAGRSRAGAKHFITLADRSVSTGLSQGRAISSMAGTTRKFGDAVSQALVGIGTALKGRRKEMVIALGASAAIAALTARPRDLTPERVDSGNLAGPGMRPPSQRLPMPQLKKNLYYKKGARPGYRVNAITNRVADHQRLAASVSQVSGGMPVTMNVGDSRRMIRRDEIENVMRSDSLRGSRTPQGSYYNSR
jgi:hypothetical protein